jgi:hypothetical protein
LGRRIEKDIENMKKTTLIIFSFVLLASGLAVLLACSIKSLSSVPMLKAISNAGVKSRDAQRISEAKSINTALTLYLSNGGLCPSSLTDLHTKMPDLYFDSIDPGSKVEYEYDRKGDWDCQVCFNLEEPLSYYKIGRNCLKAAIMPR